MWAPMVVKEPVFSLISFPNGTHYNLQVMTSSLSLFYCQKLCHLLSCNDQKMLRLWLILSVVLFPVVKSFDNHVTNESLDAFLQDLTLKALLHRRPHTNALYKADLPENLEGIKMAVVRIRSKTLWSRGANFSNIHIPRGTLPVPYVRRISLVYLDFGNWSSHFYKVKGYSLVSPVVGFMAFDASNISSNTVTKLDLNIMLKPIEIQFPSLTLPEESNGRERCARFGANRTIQITEMSTRNSCYCRNQGFLSIVVPSERKKRVWDLWLEGFVLGFVGLVVVWFVGMVLIKVLMAKKIHEMEREAEESVGLEIIWIGTSKMPSAAVTRTHPAIENASI